MHRSRYLKSSVTKLLILCSIVKDSIVPFIVFKDFQIVDVKFYDIFSYDTDFACVSKHNHLILCCRNFSVEHILPKREYLEVLGIADYKSEVKI